MAEYTPPNTINPIFNPQIFDLRDKVGTTISSGEITEIQDEIALYTTALTPAFTKTIIQNIPITKNQEQPIFQIASLPAGSYVITIQCNVVCNTITPTWTNATLFLQFLTAQVGQSTRIQQASSFCAISPPSSNSVPISATFFVQSTTSNALVNMSFILLMDQNGNIGTNSGFGTTFKVKSFTDLIYTPII